MRKHVWALLVIVAMLLTACGPALTPTTDEMTESGEVFLIALPRIVVDVDTEGNLTLLGFKMVDIGKFVGQDLSAAKLNKYYVDWMMTANVQNLELRQTGAGIALLANGRALPHIAWSDGSLKAATDVATAFGVQGLEPVGKFMPILRRLGVNVVLRFPARPGAEAMELSDPTRAIAAPKPDGNPPTAIVHFEIRYDGQGVPSILGISARELAAMGINAPLALAPSAITQLQASNIQFLQVRTRQDGAYIYVNGQALPNLVWDNDLLASAGDLYVQMNNSPYNDLVKQMLPLVDNLDISILMHFPLKPGVEPLKIEMK